MSERVSHHKNISSCVEMRTFMSPAENCKGLPSSIVEILRHARKIDYYDIPDYEGYIRNMQCSLRSRGQSENDGFSWECND